MDADLVGLTTKDTIDLIQPVLNHEADVSISMRGNTPWFHKILMVDGLSGDRVFSRKLTEEHIDEIKNLQSFALEVYLNKLFIKNKYKIKVLFWPNVASPLKFKKQGFFAGIKNEISMYISIFKTVSFPQVIYQEIKLYRQKIKP